MSIIYFNILNKILSRLYGTAIAYLKLFLGLKVAHHLINQKSGLEFIKVSEH